MRRGQLPGPGEQGCGAPLRDGRSGLPAVHVDVQVRYPVRGAGVLGEVFGDPVTWDGMTTVTEL